LGRFGGFDMVFSAEDRILVENFYKFKRSVAKKS